MPTKYLPERPDLAQLRRQAKELHKAASTGDTDALARIHSVSETNSLTTAQLALAREYGFASWRRLKYEIERKNALADGDIEVLTRLITAHPELAIEKVSSRNQDNPLTYIGVARFHGVSDHQRAGQITRLMLAAGAPPNGTAEMKEAPLITAASYGETDMARALIAAGADLEATGVAIPNGTALAHAVEFGITEVIDVLVAAGAIIHDIVEAAGAGDLSGFLTSHTPATDRACALRSAAINQRLLIIDRLLAEGLPIDAETDIDGTRATALHWAAWHGKPTATRHLLAAGADPNRRDTHFNGTPLDWCRHRHHQLSAFARQPEHAETETILNSATSTA